jgi:hypothetical protein
MDKYLTGSIYNIPMASSEVTSDELVSVAWTLDRIAPVDPTNTVQVTGSFTAVANPDGVITLPASLGTDPRQGWRLTYVFTTNTATTFTYTDEFMIEAMDTLVKGFNSFMSYMEAMLTAEDMFDISHFKLANKEDQIAALASAYGVLCTMVYADRNGDHYNIAEYDATKLDELEPAFMLALRKAMIVEANEMLDNNSIYYKRQDGIMSETIGESSMMFRPGNILNFAVTKRSMTLLNNYVVIRARLYRG